MSKEGTKTLQRKPSSFCRSWCFFALLLSGIATASDDITLQTLEFNRDIRPILAKNCFSCHGPDPNKREADLRLDQRQSAWNAGAIDPSESLIIDRIHSDDSKPLMPLPESNRLL